jgi:hypothetical protein
MEKGVFHRVALSIEVSVVFTRRRAILARWNLNSHALSMCLLGDGVAVVSLVSNQVFGGGTLRACNFSRALCRKKHAQSHDGTV